MKYKTAILTFLIFAWLIAPLAIYAQPSGQTVVALAGARSLTDLLPDTLAGAQATGDLKHHDDLAEIAGDRAAAFAEYHVRQAASREYGRLRVELFETPNQFTAFGLFTYNTGLGPARSSPQEVGSSGAHADGALIFWKDNCFVRVVSVDPKDGQVTSAHAQLARAVADSIVNDNPALRPRLLESLPPQMAARSERYFLGPESLSAYVGQGRDTFTFAGGAEAVMADYHARKEKGAAHKPLRLLIVEYHTPQFATDAMAAATSYIESLPEQERARLILKREGNFLVEAVGVEDRDFAESLVDSVKYPYIVKWLSPLPRLPKEDPLRAQKAAQLLISTFSLLGVLLATVLVAGSVVGSIVFFKRRKQQQKSFSDAGGMLRLDLDPFETIILGLPPKREE